jgi:hypothetical protein
MLVDPAAGSKDQFTDPPVGQEFFRGTFMTMAIRFGRADDGTWKIISTSVDDIPPIDAEVGKPVVVDKPDSFAGGGTATPVAPPAQSTPLALVASSKSLGVIDLMDPPQELRENVELLAAAALLTGNSLLRSTGSPETKLTFETWRNALPLFASFPPEVRRSITALAPFFAKEPKPSERHVVIAALPTWLLQEKSVIVALAYLQRDPNDPHPHVLTDAKLQKAEAERARLPVQIQEGIAFLRGAFLDPPASDELACMTQVSSTGARIHSYPGSEKAVQLVEGCLKMLALSPRFATELARMNILLAPPGQPLSYVVGAKGEGASGIALPEGLDGLDDEGQARRPTLALDVESVMRSNIVLAHEIIHLVELLDPQLMAETDKAFAKFIGKNTEGRHPYANAREMLAYLGQWYLAGQGGVLMHEASDVFSLCLKAFGKARVPARGMSVEYAEASIVHLVRWLKTGRGGP